MIALSSVSYGQFHGFFATFPLVGIAQSRLLWTCSFRVNGYTKIQPTKYSVVYPCSYWQGCLWIIRVVASRSLSYIVIYFAKRGKLCLLLFLFLLCYFFLPIKP
jgi:hypothetical protein